MKHNVKIILNEARVQRTIDPKIWASMSSMSSRLRSTLGEDAKPMKKDDISILLQKYVAGLLTMKVSCPNTVSEIEDLKAYKQIGMAYINMGGTIAEIKRLYVENGGTLSQDTNSITDTEDSHMDDLNNEIEDDSFEDENTVDNEIPEVTTDDNEIPSFDQQPTIDRHDFDKAVLDVNIPHDNDTLHDDNDEDEVAERKIELSQTTKYINTYLKRNRDILAAPKGSLLIFNENSGLFNIINTDDNNEKLPKCTGIGFNNIDKKTRFFVVSDSSYELGNPGNNEVYDDYYFRKAINSRGQLIITAGSNYYEDEETKGKFYTKILAENGNIPAMHVQEVVDECMISDPNALKVLEVSAYLPTLPELASIYNMLPSGIYWTSSVAQKGTSNIALDTANKKVLVNCKSAKVAAFIRFN